MFIFLLISVLTYKKNIKIYKQLNVELHVKP